MTAIEWTDRTWNPVRGCSVISPGCANCYAMKQAHRFNREGAPYEGLTKRTDASGPQWTGRIMLAADKLAEPLHWKTRSLVFVNSMSDLFHETVPDAFIDQAFAVMALSPQHTYQILTKRAARMREYLLGLGRSFKRLQGACPLGWSLEFNGYPLVGWPLPNVWIGVSAENQEYAEARIPELLASPAALRFVSCEPLLGPIDLRNLDTGPEMHLDALSGVETMAEVPANGPRLDWVIVGGESGPRARPCALNWIDQVVQQCGGREIPVFVKQVGSFVVDESRTVPAHAVADEDVRRRYAAPDGSLWAWRASLGHARGGDPAEWPAPLRVRQMPAEAALRAR